jgi:hypothetical protein
VPGRLAVIAVAGGAFHDGGALLGRQRRRIGQKSSKESVQPGTLRLGEWRTGWDDFDLWRRRDLVHEDT